MLHGLASQPAVATAGEVHLGGLMRSAQRADAAGVAAASVAGGGVVTSHLSVLCLGAWAMMWAQ